MIFSVTGVNVYLIAGIVCAVCVFYTFIGGIKAVVHTDAWQVVVMFISVVVVTVLGTVAAGGFGKIFDTAAQGNRIILLKCVFKIRFFYERITKKIYLL